MPSHRLFLGCACGKKRRWAALARHDLVYNLAGCLAGWSAKRKEVSPPKERNDQKLTERRLAKPLNNFLLSYRCLGSGLAIEWVFYIVTYIYAGKHKLWMVSVMTTYQSKLTFFIQIYKFRH